MPNVSTAKRRLSFLGRMLKENMVSKDKKCPYCGVAESTLLARKHLVLQLRKCNNCNLLFRWPKDSQKFNTSFYQHDYSQDGLTTDTPSSDALGILLKNNFKGSEKDYSNQVSLLKRYLSEGLVLDYGCSWGYFTYQLAKAGYNSHGFEISKPRAMFGKNNLNVPILHDRDELLQKFSGKFDAIVSYHVLEHVPSLQDVFSTFNGLLNDSGLLILWLPNGDGAAAKSMGVNWGASISEKHVTVFTREFLAGALAENGFEYRLFSDTDSPVSFEDKAVSTESACEGEHLIAVAQKIEAAE